MSGNYNIFPVVPLDNGKKTIRCSDRDLYIQGGAKVTAEEIVSNPALYEGKKVGYGSEDYNFRKTEDYSIVSVSGENIYLIHSNYNEHINPRLDLGALDLTRNAAELKNKVGDVKYVNHSQSLVLGELSVVYGSPGSGKTLVGIYDVSMCAHYGGIDAEKVIYVNLDDSARGLAEKAELLEKVGIKMISQFDTGMLNQLIRAGQCEGVVVILDTLKKVVPVNEKSEVASFLEKCKEFTRHGGTVILIAHANKHPIDGKPVLEGAGDLKNDVDCVVQVTRSGDLIRLIHEKSRSHVESNITFQTGDHQDYRSLLQSVRLLHPEEYSILLRERGMKKFKTDHRHIIDEIFEAMGKGGMLKTDLTKKVASETGESRKLVIKVLSKLEGDCWQMEKGLNNSKVYTLIFNADDSLARDASVPEQEPVPDYITVPGVEPPDYLKEPEKEAV